MSLVELKVDTVINALTLYLQIRNDNIERNREELIKKDMDERNNSLLVKAGVLKTITRAQSISRLQERSAYLLTGICSVWDKFEMFSRIPELQDILVAAQLAKRDGVKFITVSTESASFISKFVPQPEDTPLIEYPEEPIHQLIELNDNPINVDISQLRK